MDFNVNREMLGLLAVAAMIALAGCGGESVSTETPSSEQEDLDESSNIDTSDVELGESYYFEVRATEANQLHLVKTQPPFKMDSSLERENLIRRYQYLNDENNVHHVYLMQEGQVVAYYVAQGKVSSVNSKLTNDVQIVRIKGCEVHKDNYKGAYFGTTGPCYRTVESPQMDGSYGTNGEAIFFFTTSGQYVETSLDYVVSEQPMNIQDEVILRKNIGEDTTNTTSSNETAGNIAG